MQIEDYFDFLAPTDIRVKGTRVGLETILADYLDLGLSAEEITLRYPSLALDQVYATLAYYWRNRAQLDDYLRRVDQAIAEQRRTQELHPSPGIARLRAIAQQRRAATAPTEG